MLGMCVSTVLDKRYNLAGNLRVSRKSIIQCLTIRRYINNTMNTDLQTVNLNFENDLSKLDYN